MQPPDRKRHAWARALLTISIVLGAWAALIAVTGGFRIELGPIRLSSRNAVRVFLIALVPAALAWRFAYHEWLDARVRESLPVLRRGAVVLACLFAAGLLTMGVLYGARAAAAADGSGYVSQSALWRLRSLRIDQAFTAALPWPEAQHSFTPLGYRAGSGNAMVPTYAPGLPLLMAAAHAVTPCAQYLVGPLSGAALVLATFFLGRRAFGTAVATAAAALTACSPVVLFMSFSPMADVPAAAFWMAALACGAAASGRASLASGVLTGIAVLIRPNLVPLAVFPWALAIVRCRAIRPFVVRTLLFAAGSVPAALFIAWLNGYLYGSALTSGYGDLGDAFELRFAVANLRLYPAWWLESQGPLAFAFVAALFRRRERMSLEVFLLAGFAAALWLLYLFYLPFEAWWFLRFLLPAVPIAFLLCADVVDWAARGSAAVRIAALAAFTLVAAGQAARFVDTHEVTGIGVGEQRYVEPELYIAATTPREAVVLTMQHSGSLRYHAGRLTMRWDALDPQWLDRAVEHMRGRGVTVYALLEYWEEPQFRERFKGQRLLAELDRGPAATARGGEIRFYPLTDTSSSERRVAVEIPLQPQRECLDVSPDYVTPAAVAKLR